jgi:hypothetical protein
MPDKRSAAIRRRIAPFTPLVLMLEEQGGAFYRVELKLAFDMNAGAAIQERTADPKMNFRGYMLTHFRTWANISEPMLLKAMFWGAVLAHHPEYNSDEGFDTVGTFIQENNSEEILEAIEKAYLAYLPKERAEELLKLKAKAKAEEVAKLKGDGAETDVPLDGTNQTSPSAGSRSGPSPDTTSELKVSTNSAG